MLVAGARYFLFSVQNKGTIMTCKREKKKRTAERGRVGAISAQEPRSHLGFRESMVPQEVALPPTSGSTLSFEEKELTRLYRTFATMAWRMKRVLIDMETEEPKKELSDRNISKLARYLDSLDGALENARVEVKGDYEGEPYDVGDVVKVITFEERQDLSRDEYVETLTPTIRWTDKEGNPRLLQQAEVIVGKASKH